MSSLIEVEQISVSTYETLKELKKELSQEVEVLQKSKDLLNEKLEVLDIDVNFSKESSNIIENKGAKLVAERRVNESMKEKQAVNVKLLKLDKQIKEKRTKLETQILKSERELNNLARDTIRRRSESDLKLTSAQKKLVKNLNEISNPANEYDLIVTLNISMEQFLNDPDILARKMSIESLVKNCTAINIPGAETSFDFVYYKDDGADNLKIHVSMNCDFIDVLETAKIVPSYILTKIFYEKQDIFRSIEIVPRVILDGMAYMHQLQIRESIVPENMPKLTSTGIVPVSIADFMEQSIVSKSNLNQFISSDGNVQLEVLPNLDPSYQLGPKEFSGQAIPENEKYKKCDANAITLYTSGVKGFVQVCFSIAQFRMAKESTWNILAAKRARFLTSKEETELNLEESKLRSEAQNKNVESYDLYKKMYADKEQEYIAFIERQNTETEKFVERGLHDKIVGYITARYQQAFVFFVKMYEGVFAILNDIEKKYSDPETSDTAKKRILSLLHRIRTLFGKKTDRSEIDFKFGDTIIENCNSIDAFVTNARCFSNDPEASFISFYNEKAVVYNDILNMYVKVTNDDPYSNSEIFWDALSWTTEKISSFFQSAKRYVQRNKTKLIVATISLAVVGSSIAVFFTAEYAFELAKGFVASSVDRAIFVAQSLTFSLDGFLTTLCMINVLSYGMIYNYVRTKLLSYLIGNLATVASRYVSDFIGLLTASVQDVVKKQFARVQNDAGKVSGKMDLNDELSYKRFAARLDQMYLIHEKQGYKNNTHKTIMSTINHVAIFMMGSTEAALAFQVVNKLIWADSIVSSLDKEFSKMSDLKRGYFYTLWLGENVIAAFLVLLFQKIEKMGTDYLQCSKRLGDIESRYQEKIKSEEERKKEESQIQKHVERFRENSDPVLLKEKEKDPVRFEKVVREKAEELVAAEKQAEERLFSEEAAKNDRRKKNNLLRRFSQENQDKRKESAKKFDSKQQKTSLGVPPPGEYEQNQSTVPITDKYEPNQSTAPPTDKYEPNRASVQNTSMTKNNPSGRFSQENKNMRKISADAFNTKKQQTSSSVPPPGEYEQNQSQAEWENVTSKNSTIIITNSTDSRKSTQEVLAIGAILAQFK